MSGFVSFFFFKQKTAYEMRISDWSSDVCSSDLLPDVRGAVRAVEMAGVEGIAAAGDLLHRRYRLFRGESDQGARWRLGAAGDRPDHLHPADHLVARSQADAAEDGRRGDADRSEEHTSELQSLMRISYAVFCLKKKIN